ncbi:MAG: D-alanyl-D-alanine carboxypeptidase [Ruminococcaceae bacterium]|nr:D-alanyl-D-alanine carboxypeptidase [Oscillospiraceae bacterium]
MLVLKRAAAIFLSVLVAFSMVSLSASATGNSVNNTNSEHSAYTVVPTNDQAFDMTLDCKSAILMEAGTGAVLFEQNADEAFPPASVTKIMTLLLVMEAIEQGKISLDDTVTASAHAASMGGSQIYLKEGEQMSVEDMLKSVVISSANDAACALAEFVSGSEEAFVRQMNERAAQLGMKNTSFENTNGLDDTVESHLTSARDIAIMSRELIKHEKILEYSSIWMDTIRGGMFGLTNTNRLVRFYRGCTGLKTGSTSKAGFCISATAERDGVSLICVIMGAETRDIRNSLAIKLLDYGFANYGVYTHAPQKLENIKVTCGVKDSVSIQYDAFEHTLPKSEVSKVTYKIELPQSVSAPIKQGDVLGKVTFAIDGKEIGTRDVYAAEDILKISFSELWLRIMAKFLLK